MSTSTRFLQTQAGKQAAFETPVTPTFQMPFTGEYEDRGDFQTAELDDGRWLPAVIVDRSSTFATFNLRGAGFFELLPVFLNAMFADMTPAGGTAPYSYDYTLDLTTPGTPAPYTFFFGGGENLGVTGPAVRVQDAYCQSLIVAGNANDRSVTYESTWFGAGVDDNSGAGHAFAAVAIPAGLGMMKYPFGKLEYADATATGGVFDTMSSFACTMLDWRLTINSGLQPKWSGDANKLSYCGVFIGRPSVQFQVTLRTNATTYAAVMAKANGLTPTYQEIQFTQTGADSRQAIWQMTGRWLPVLTAHRRSGDEVTMQATFEAGGYYAQTTTPHAFGWQIDTAWSHT